MLALHSTNLLDYTLTDRITGDSVSGATVTGSIRDPLGELLDLGDEETTFEMVEQSGGGVYRYELPPELELVYGQVYRVEITSDADGVITFDVERLVALEN